MMIAFYCLVSEQELYFFDMRLANKPIKPTLSSLRFARAAYGKRYNSNSEKIKS